MNENSRWLIGTAIAVAGLIVAVLAWQLIEPVVLRVANRLPASVRRCLRARVGRSDGERQAGGRRGAELGQE